MHRHFRLQVLEDRTVPAMGIPKSFVIAIDGLRGDGITNATTPNLRSLIAGTWGDGPGIDYHGAYADYASTILDAITVSGPNHTSIYTGVTAVKHGVTGNNSGQMAAVTYPDYLKLLELNNPARGTAKLVSWSLDDLVPSGADYRRVQLEELNAQLAADIAAGVAGNGYTTATGNSNIDAMFLFFDNLDYTGHDSGFTPGNPAYRAQLNTIDGLIGLVLNAIASRPTFAAEDWQIVVTSDHGGRGTSHGYMAADNFTIPFLVCSRSVGQGWISGTPSNVDVLPTVLEHFDVPVPANIDGVARGLSVRSFPTTTLEQDRVANLKFDFNLLDSSGTAAPINASVGGGSPTYLAGKFGQAVALKSGSNAWLTLGNPSSLQFGSESDFSYALWYKSDGGQTGIPAIFSNQNLAISTSPGFTLSANQGTGSQIGQSVVGETGTLRDFDFVDINVGDWIFLAGTLDRDGNGLLYVGYDGILYKLAQNVVPVGNINSTLPWNIGQDGTGTYANGLNGAIDEFSIWRRELRDDEIRSLWEAGNVPPLPPLIAYPDSYSVNEDEMLSINAPGLLTNDYYSTTVLYSESFDSLPLGPAVEESGGDGTDFTHTPPVGWSINRSGVPGWGTNNNGVFEWAGWSIADKNFWTTVSENQNRSDFTRGNGAVVVADPDEWDDQSHPGGTYNTFMTTSTISLSGVRANSLTLSFDSSFRPYANQEGFIDVSYDNFANVTRIFSRTTQDLRNEAVSIPLNNPTGGGVRFRFGLINAGNDWWWAIDNLVVRGVLTSTVLTSNLVTAAGHGTAVVNANGSFTYTPNPNFSGADGFSYSSSSGGNSTTAPVTITVVPRPDVASVVVNGDSPQRSMLTSLRVEFDMLLNSTLFQQQGTFVLTRLSDGANVGTINVSPTTINGVTVATLTFAGANTEYGSLADGNWRLTVSSTNVVASSNGLNMGQSVVIDGIKRLFGDSDGNGTVNSVDFATFRTFFGLGASIFDFDGDAQSNSSDFAEFRKRFGISLAP